MCFLFSFSLIHININVNATDFPTHIRSNTLQYVYRENKKCATGTTDRHTDGLTNGQLHQPVCSYVPSNINPAKIAKNRQCVQTLQ